MKIDHQLPSFSQLPINRRFRGFLPVVVDVETAGFDSERDALLEVAAITLKIDEDGFWHPDQTYSCHILPFEGANLDEKSLAFTGIDPYHPFRFAVSETEGLNTVFRAIRQAIRYHDCNRAILVGHNPMFDLNFINAAAKRVGVKRNPFHPFSTFDTATLGGLAYGQTVLARAVQAAGLSWNADEAHSAIYDAERTADLFCTIVNSWNRLTY